MTHEEKMKSLDDIGHDIDGVIAYNKELMEKLATSHGAERIAILQEIDSCGSRLVELSRKVVNVHTGKSTKTPDKAVKRGGIQFVGFDD